MPLLAPHTPFTGVGLGLGEAEGLGVGIVLGDADGLGDAVGGRSSGVADGAAQSTGVLLSPRFSIPGAIAPLSTLAIRTTIITLPARMSRYSREV